MSLDIIPSPQELAAWKVKDLQCKLDHAREVLDSIRDVRDDSRCSDALMTYIDQCSQCELYFYARDKHSCSKS